jgi:hypothetical protein
MHSTRTGSTTAARHRQAAYLRKWWDEVEAELEQIERDKPDPDRDPEEAAEMEAWKAIATNAEAFKAHIKKLQAEVDEYNRNKK